MGFNLKKALANMKKDLKAFKNIEFEYTHDEDGIDASASNVSLNGFDDDIYISFYAFESGSAFATAYFDKIEPSYDAYNLINKFNDDNIHLKAFISEKGFLTFKHVRRRCDEKDFDNFASDFLGEIASLTEDETVCALVAMTDSE